MSDKPISDMEAVKAVYPDALVLRSDWSGNMYVVPNSSDVSYDACIGFGNTIEEAWRDVVKTHLPKCSRLPSQGEGEVVAMCDEHGFTACDICSESEKPPISLCKHCGLEIEPSKVDDTSWIHKKSRRDLCEISVRYLYAKPKESPIPSQPQPGEPAGKALHDALAWALPLAILAQESHRLERLKCGHNDIGAGRGSDLGLWDEEVAARDRAKAALALAAQPPSVSDGLDKSTTFKEWWTEIHDPEDDGVSWDVYAAEQLARNSWNAAIRLSKPTPDGVEPIELSNWLEIEIDQNLTGVQVRCSPLVYASMQHFIGTRSQPKPTPDGLVMSEREELSHKRNCAAWTNAQGDECGERCTCGLYWRKQLLASQSKLTQALAEIGRLKGEKK